MTASRQARHKMLARRIANAKRYKGQCPECLTLYPEATGTCDGGWDSHRPVEVKEWDPKLPERFR